MKIRVHKNGTKVDLAFFFQQLRLKVNFECSVSLYVLTNTKKVESEEIGFDVAKTKFIGDLRTDMNSSVILFPHKKNTIEINVLLLTKKGKKCAGLLRLNLDDILRDGQENFVLPLEKCPDRKAKMSFKLKISNPTDLEQIESTPTGRKKDVNTTNMSFYSHLNGEDSSFNKNNSHNTSGLSLKMRQISRKRSKSPGGAIKLNFGAKRVRPASRNDNLQKRLSEKNFGSDRKAFPLQKEKEKEEKRRATIFDSPRRNNLEKDVEEHKRSRAEIKEDQNLDKKLRNLEDNFLIVNNDNDKLKREKKELERELELLKNQLSDKGDSDLNRLEREVGELTAELEKKEEELYTKKLESEEFENKFNEARGKHYEVTRKHEREVKSLQAELKALKNFRERDSEGTKDGLRELERENKKLRKKNDTLEEENFHLEEKYSDAKQKVFDLETDFENKKDEFDQQLREVEGRLLVEKNKSDLLQKDNKKVEELHKEEVKALNEDNDKLAQRIRKLKSQSKELEIELEVLREDRGRDDHSLIQDNAQSGELRLELEKTKRGLREKERELRETREEAEEFKQRKEKEINAFDEEIKLLSEEIDHLQKNNHQLSSGVGEEWKKKHNELQDKLELREEEIRDYKKKVKSLERERREMEEEVEEAKKGKREAEKKLIGSRRGDSFELQSKELEEKEKTISKLKREINRLEDTIQDKNGSEEIGELEAINQQLERTVSLKEEDIKELKKEVSSLKKQLQEKKEDGSEELQSKLDKLKEQLDSAEEELERLREVETKSKELEETISGLQKQVEKKKQKALYESDDLALLTVENENLKKKVKMLNLRVTDAKSLEKEVQSLKDKEKELVGKLDSLTIEHQQLEEKFREADKNGGGGITKEAFSQLEKNFIDSQTKIAAVIQAIQEAKKMKKEHKNKLLNILVG